MRQDQELLTELEESLAAAVRINLDSTRRANTANVLNTGISVDYIPEGLPEAESVGVSRDAVERVLNAAAERLNEHEEESVGVSQVATIFVIAPRMRFIFGNTEPNQARYANRNPRLRYHYTSGGGGIGKIGCASAWVGAGRFLVLDLSAGSCDWSTHESVFESDTGATHYKTHAGDHTQ